MTTNVPTTISNNTPPITTASASLVDDGTTLSRQHRRKSVEDFTSLIIQDIRSTFERLTQLWDQVHMETPVRENRARQAYELVHSLLQDMMVQSVATELEARLNTVSALRKLSKQPPFEEQLFPQGSIALLRALNEEMNRLQMEWDEAMGKQLELQNKYEALCHRTGTVAAHHIEGVHERILTDAEFDHLSNKVKQMRALFTKRLQDALLLQFETKKIYDSIQFPPNNSIEEEDLHCMRIDLHSPSMVLSQELLGKLSTLNQRLKDHYDAWIEQAAFRYDELLIKLDSLAAKCFCPPVSNEYPKHINPEGLPRELQKLEQELQARQRVYERAQPVFDKVNEWMESWKQKLDMERRVNRASFYKNQAGSLNTKLKERRIVEQKVPKLLNELRMLCEEYVNVKHYQVDDILVEGQRADQYAESVVKSYEQDRKVQRAQKQQQKNRRAPSTVTGIPDRTTRKRSFSCSQLSAIHPGQASADSGPRTS